MSVEISLKPLTDVALPRLVEMVSKPQVNRWLPFAADFSIETAQQMLAVVHDKSNDYMCWTVHGSEQLNAIGAMTMVSVWHPRCMQVGFWIDPNHQGKGFATAALGAFCKTAFGELEVARIQAQVEPENEASIRVLEKNGFEREGLAKRSHLIKGEFKDTYLYSRTE